jgi:hypothetical protein
MKKFGKAIIPLIVLLCMFGNLKSQTSGYDFYTIVAQKENYFDSLRGILPDNAKIPGWRSYERWKDFWMNRVHNDATVTGSMSKYGTNLIAAYSTPAMQPNSTSAFNWQLAGPQDLTTHNKGVNT